MSQFPEKPQQPTGSQDLPGNPLTRGSASSAVEKAPTERPRQYTLATLLLLTTLIAICLAILRASAVFGTLALLVIVPALVRAALIALRAKRYERRLAAHKKVLVFFESLFVVFAAIVVASFVLYVIFAIGIWLAVALGSGSVAEPSLAIGSLILAIIGAVASAIWIFRGMWPSERDFMNFIQSGPPPSAQTPNQGDLSP